jgi:hypothetical protein
LLQFIVGIPRCVSIRTSVCQYASERQRACPESRVDRQSDEHSLYLRNTFGPALGIQGNCLATMTDWHPPRTVSHRETKLAFAARLTDRFTGDRPADATLSLDPVDADPVTNRSGYHVFLDLDAAAVTLTVDGGDRYVDERRRVVLDAGAADDTSAEEVPTHVVTDPADPLELALSPTPAYAFPSSATVVRGHVADTGGDPVAGAAVEFREFDPVVETTETGEFALWVPVSADHVVRRDDRNVVAVDTLASDGGAALADGDGTDPTLVVSHADHGETSESVEVTAGSRTVHYVTLQ